MDLLGWHKFLRRGLVSCQNFKQIEFSEHMKALLSCVGQEFHLNIELIESLMSEWIAMEFTLYKISLDLMF